eukprot:gb/GECG01005453.1/.p1 GENE.gb/GECG01005453.1/~~gb/GECG01005453.1/.p1  ORF type:complete len:403 (+),score=49.50 gb/GECG01005453.1/:1-1209(+)
MLTSVKAVSLFHSRRNNSCVQAIDDVYQGILPKHRHPFVYLALEIPPSHIDVNVHPTKQEVEILHGDTLIERIVDQLKDSLEGANSSRVFEAQTFLPTYLGGDDDRSAGQQTGSTPVPKSSNGQVLQPAAHKKNRMDSRDTKVDGYMPSGHRPEQTDRPTSDTEASSSAGPSSSYYAAAASRVARQPMTPVYLSSIQELLQEIANMSDSSLLEIIRSYVFVGMVDRCRSLIQVDTKLLLVDHRNLAIEFFYQQAIRFFNNFKRISISPRVPIQRIVRLALEDKSIVEDAPSDTSTLKKEVDEATEFLGAQAEMLEEYFSISIEADSENGGQLCLSSIPCLLDEYVPSYKQLPMFVARLIWNVNWKEEKPCFRGIARALGEFYGDALPLTDEGSSESENGFLE